MLYKIFAVLLLYTSKMMLIVESFAFLCEIWYIDIRFNISNFISFCYEMLYPYRKNNLSTFYHIFSNFIHQVLKKNIFYNFIDLFICILNGNKEFLFQKMYFSKIIFNLYGRIHANDMYYTHGTKNTIHRTVHEKTARVIFNISYKQTHIELLLVNRIYKVIKGWTNFKKGYNILQ